jgi:hypothetical protein
MRTKTLLLTAALCAAGIATSKAQVYSVNAVGYVNTALKPGYNLVANPLDNKAANGNTIASLFAALPPGSQFFVFDGTKYTLADVPDFGGAIEGPAANTVIAPGNGIFVRVDAAATVTFVGEVPSGPLSNPIPAGFSIKASQVPQAGKISTDLLFPAAEGDQVFSFDAGTQKYSTGNYSFGAWDTEPSLDVGQAVFVRTDVAKPWVRNFDITK